MTIADRAIQDQVESLQRRECVRVSRLIRAVAPIQSRSSPAARARTKLVQARRARRGGTTPSGRPLSIRQCEATLVHRRSALMKALGCISAAEGHHVGERGAGRVAPPRSRERGIPLGEDEVSLEPSTPAANPCPFPYEDRLEPVASFSGGRRLSAMWNEAMKRQGSRRDLSRAKLGRHGPAVSSAG